MWFHGRLERDEWQRVNRRTPEHKVWKTPRRRGQGEVRGGDWICPAPCQVANLPRPLLCTTTGHHHCLLCALLPTPMSKGHPGDMFGISPRRTCIPQVRLLGPRTPIRPDSARKIWIELRVKLRGPEQRRYNALHRRRRRYIMYRAATSS